MVEVESVGGAEAQDAPYPAGDGRIVVGRRFTNDDNHYTTVMVDELLFFNQTLSNDTIDFLYTSVGETTTDTTTTAGWTGPDTVIYWSFDNNGDLVTMEGT